MSTHSRFQDFLMHGVLDHHSDPTNFCVDQLTPHQFLAFRELVTQYFAQGHPDPGLMALPLEDRENLARAFPQQFDLGT